MKLIIIYGPPAAGKLTVAQAVSAKTGYKLFHNHLTVDLIKNFLEFGTEEFFALNQHMKIKILEACAKQNIPGLIMTFVYDKNTDNPYLFKIVDVCKEYKVEIQFVQLICSQEELLKRVTQPSRKAFKKVGSIESLTRYLESGNFVSSIDIAPNLKIDNTALNAEEVADMICRS